MKLFLFSMIVFAALFALAIPFLSRRRRVETFNIGEGSHPDGRVSYLADADHAERYSLVKRGALNNSTAICGAADVPIGVSTDTPKANGAHTVRLFSGKGTQLMVASAAIVQDALVEPAANGRVATLGAGAGTHWVMGRAITAATAAGQQIEVDMTFQKLVI